MLGGNNKRRKKDTVGDQISELSDDILVKILSCLTIKEAARTSKLSSRWRYLWKGFTGCLNFDDPLTMADLTSVWYLKTEPLDVERHKFVNWVNQVLGSLEGPFVEELRVCFDVVSNGDIDNWVKFALERRVQRLELDFTRVENNLWCFGQYLFVSHKSITGEHCVLGTTFSSLTTLKLTRVSITREILEQLLVYCCPVLEVLSVTQSVTLTSLKVSGDPSSSLKLKHLKLKFVDSLKDLELRAPNLLSFEYSGPLVPICFKNVPNLVEISIGDHLSTYIMTNMCQHSSFLMQLRTLRLDMSLLYILNLGSYCNNIPELCNLKHLEIIGEPEVNCLILCVALLKASSSLYKFTLKLLSQPAYGWPQYESIETIKDHPYLSSFTAEFTRLRVVELQGFVGHAGDVEFVMYLLKSAKLLEKIIIDSCGPGFVGTPTELICREWEKHQSARRRALQLAAKFPLWEFVIP